MAQAMARGLAAAALCALAAGCNGGPPKGTVTGKVVFDGKPVAGGQISFVQANGVPKTANINEDGSYKVEDLAPGDATVLVTGPTVGPPPDPVKMKNPRAAPPPPA